MTLPIFKSPVESHNHSLRTLNILYEYDDFMESIGTLADLGAGSGLDIEWWATRTTRELHNPKPLNIKCTAFDLQERFPVAQKYKNIIYQRHDFETPLPLPSKKKYDLIWCHDAFQYVINPFQTLSYWRDALSENGMFILIVPQTTNIVQQKQAFDQQSKCYFHWTMVSLIHVLSVLGFDCANGFYFKDSVDPWLHAAVYKGNKSPLDPRTATWYDLAEDGRLPESCVQSILKYGYLRQQDLVIKWLDHSLMWMGAH